MTLTRWMPRNTFDPWTTMRDLQQEMNQIFHSFGLRDAGWPNLTLAFPACNVWEDGDNVFVEAELPGMDLNDLEIYVTGGNQLTLQGERKRPEFDKVAWHRQERGFGRFSRTVTLPAAVEADQVTANFRHGVLTVTLPKAATARPRRIPVVTG